MTLHNIFRRRHAPDIVGPVGQITGTREETGLVIRGGHPDGAPEWVWRENDLMKHWWPGFSCRHIDDDDTIPSGAFSWSGRLKPGIYEDLEWDITAVCLGINGRNSDWSGAIAIYFTNPSGNQIVEALGYRPACMLLDSQWHPILCNLRPVRLRNCTVAEAVWHAFRLCHTIEQICAGRLPEDILRDNRYMSNWENEDFPIPFSSQQ